MKFFQSIQKNHVRVGICSKRTNESNRKIALIFFLFGMSFTCSLVYLCLEANTFLEYSNNMYITTGSAMILIVYTINIFKMSKLFKFIDYLEEMIDERELDSQITFFYTYLNAYYFNSGRIQITSECNL